LQSDTLTSYTAIQWLGDIHALSDIFQNC